MIPLYTFYLFRFFLWFWFLSLGVNYPFLHQLTKMTSSSLISANDRFPIVLPQQSRINKKWGLHHPHPQPPTPVHNWCKIAKGDISNLGIGIGWIWIAVVIFVSFCNTSFWFTRKLIRKYYRRLNYLLIYLIRLSYPEFTIDVSR